MFVGAVFLGIGPLWLEVSVRGVPAPLPAGEAESLAFPPPFPPPEPLPFPPTTIPVRLINLLLENPPEPEEFSLPVEVPSPGDPPIKNAAVCNAVAAAALLAT